ncbi:hypothetical protein D3C78_1961840 [compost metagenome]
MWNQTDTTTTKKRDQPTSSRKISGGTPSIWKKAFSSPLRSRNHFQMRPMTTGDSSTG